MTSLFSYFCDLISRDSSVRKVTIYGPDDRVSILDRGRYLSLRRHVQIYAVQFASYPMGTGADGKVA